MAPESRKQGIAKYLMNYLENISIKTDCYFVDLFVRSTNKVAIEMYKAFGKIFNDNLFVITLLKLYFAS